MKKSISVVALLFAASAAHAEDGILPMASKPEEVGLSSTQLKRVEEVTQKHIDEGLVPGAVMLVARRGKIAWMSVLGKRDVAAGDAMKFDSIFRIYSMTKPITSIALMQLVEEGKLQVSDPVAKYLPEIGKMKVGTEVVVDGKPVLQLSDPVRPMTVQDLLRHTSGLTYGSRGSSLINAAYDVLKKPQSATSSSGGYRRYEPEEDEGDTSWVMAGYSGGMRPSSRINRQNYTDVNFIKKRMWELSGKSREEWTIWGFDGHFLRGVTTVYGSNKIFPQMAEAMVTWQTKGGNSYPCRAVLVEKRGRERTAYVIWADGTFYDKKPIPIEYDTFNQNPGNDSSFTRRLERLLDELQANEGRSHDQPSMDMPGGGEKESSAEFEVGSWVVHPKMGIGRVINPQIRKGVTRAHFGDAIGTRNVKTASLRPYKR